MQWSEETFYYKVQFVLHLEDFKLKFPTIVYDETKPEKNGP